MAHFRDFKNVSFKRFMVRDEVPVKLLFLMKYTEFLAGMVVAVHKLPLIFTLSSFIVFRPMLINVGLIIPND